MITVRYLGVQPQNLDPHLGAAQILQVVRPDLLHVYLNLAHINHALISPFDDISGELARDLVPLDQPGQPWGEVMTMREARPLTRNRAIRVEFTENGILWRFPRHTVSPLFLAHMERMGTHLHRSYAPRWVLDGRQPPTIA